MQKFEASRAQDAEAKARVLANWQRAAEMKAEFPEFAINWLAVFRPPGSGSGDNKRIMGLHPDVPLSGRVLKELRTPGLE